MDIKVVRKEYSPKSTIGELHVDDRFECFTLEDRVRAMKVRETTAIPPGRYEVVVTWSNRFKRPLPLLMNVPNYDGVRIHTGNTDENTEGCLLVGKTKRPDFVGGSKLAFDALFPKIQAAAQREKVFLEIVQENAPPDLLARAMAPMTRARAAPAAPRTKKKPVGRQPVKRPVAKRSTKRAAAPKKSRARSK